MFPEQLNIDVRDTPVMLKEASDGAGNTDIDVEELMSCPTWIIGRCAHVLHASYGGKNAVLKLSWSRTDRLPEGAVYKILESRGVSNIPKIFASGVLVKNVDGYRLEFLLMEHCGTPIVEYFQSQHGGFGAGSDAATKTTPHVKQVTATLAEALEAGVLHRDISAGNITVNGGRAYVIDWGCARFIDPPANLDLRTEIATKWCFDWNVVLETGIGNDQFVGTPLYKSCRLLYGSSVRSVYDDLESLFYVILDALSVRSRTAGPEGQPDGFAFFRSTSMALTRLSCMQSSDTFLRCFMARVDYRTDLFKTLEDMRRFLFTDNGVDTIASVVDRRDSPRTFDRDAANSFMCEATIQKMLILAGEQMIQAQVSVEPDTLPMRKRARASSTSSTESTSISSPECTSDSSHSARSIRLTVNKVVTQTRIPKPLVSTLRNARSHASSDLVKVHKVAKYLEGRSRNSFGASIGEHNNKKAILTPLLSVSERWRSAALESICDNCELTFDYKRRAVGMNIPVRPVDYSYPGFRKAHLVKRYEGLMFPSADTLVLVVKEDESKGFVFGITAVSSERVASFTHSLLQLVPAVTGVHVDFVATNLKEASSADLHGAPISGIYKGKVSRAHVTSKIFDTTMMPLDFGVVSGLTSITHGSNLSCSPFALLACRNASTPKSLDIKVATQTDWPALIYGGMETPTVYSSLESPSLTVTDDSYSTTWAGINGLAPFPSLAKLAVFGGYPLDDYLLFRSNGATMQRLEIPFCTLARNALSRFNILKRSGVTQMSLIRIDGVKELDRLFIAGRSDVAITPLVHRILEVATTLRLAGGVSNEVIYPDICTAPSTSILRHLDLGSTICAADSLFAILVALPSLVSLRCGICPIGANLEAIPTSQRPSHLHAKYKVLSSNFRTLLVIGSSDKSAETIAYTAMILAVVCPNFVHVDLPLDMRSAFGREIAWGSISDTFKSYADSICRLMYKESC
ncbi:hypothetical protein GGI20_004082 [Coemansia sp. BCRC 34301]|nr:hypothetical protein GGI20_004082 [Coemansia sp. BCRC 34301]